MVYEWQRSELVILVMRKITLGPSQAKPCSCFLQQVAWINLEVISRSSQLDPLHTLPIRPGSDLAASSLQILASHPDLDHSDLDQVELPMLMPRLPHLTNEEIMMIAGIPMEELRHTRSAQDWLAANAPTKP